MREITTKARPNRFSKETYIFNLKAYDRDDLFDDKLFPERKRTFDYILRRRIKHINTTETQRAKTKVIKGMVKLIFKFYIRIIVREILNNEAFEIPKIGFLRMLTFKFNNKYQGYSNERQIQKLSNRNDMPVICDQRDIKKYTRLEYYISLHGKAKMQLKEKIKQGIKYIK